MIDLPAGSPYPESPNNWAMLSSMLANIGADIFRASAQGAPWFASVVPGAAMPTRAETSPLCRATATVQTVHQIARPKMTRYTMASAPEPAGAGSANSWNSTPAEIARIMGGCNAC